MDVKGVNPAAYVPEPAQGSPVLTTPLLNTGTPKEGLEVAEPKCGLKQCCTWLRTKCCGKGCCCDTKGSNGCCCDTNGSKGCCGKGCCCGKGARDLKTACCGRKACCVGAAAGVALFLAFAVSLGVWAHYSWAVVDNASQALGALGVSWEQEELRGVKCALCGKAWQFAITLVVALSLAVWRAKLLRKLAQQGPAAVITRKAKIMHVGLTFGMYALFWMLTVWVVLSLVVDYLAAGLVFWTWQLTQTSLAAMDTYGPAVQVAGQPCPGQCLDLNTYAWMDKEHFGDVCVCDRDQVQQAADILFEARRPFGHVAGSIWTVFVTALIMMAITVARSSRQAAQARAQIMGAAQGAAVAYGAPAYGAMFNSATAPAAATKADAV